MDPLWLRTDLKVIHHKILWWIIDVGAMRKTLSHGWQAEAAGQLHIHRITLSKNVEYMVRVGLLLEGPMKGEAMLNPEALRSFANPTNVKTR